MKNLLGMTDPFETLYNALADASNALHDISDIPDTPDTVVIRASIDKHIDAALSDIRSWREALEEKEEIRPRKLHGRSAAQAWNDCGRR